ncbi:hypothetical protein BDA96_06G130400 [Sorghum bicolor]|uniref:Uncharacterized protein n=2 Tax=Sorghum bicolor TaxID=4558 RepID=A0A1B6PLK3_SORBI|nr:hypothetical protein BDA96_06G130400 [Sorghum bicolor]KXG26539.1 hypothetical protein SORBI_3006G117700 [Sorghum bicolor]KXG26540.1 hypothetical protein SORBI_3006G117700 [Sorghum bicolor]
MSAPFRPAPEFVGCGRRQPQPRLTRGGGGTRTRSRGSPGGKLATPEMSCQATWPGSLRAVFAGGHGGGGRGPAGRNLGTGLRGAARWCRAEAGICFW